MDLEHTFYPFAQMNSEHLDYLIKALKKLHEENIESQALLQKLDSNDAQNIALTQAELEWLRQEFVNIQTCTTSTKKILRLIKQLPPELQLPAIQQSAEETAGQPTPIEDMARDELLIGPSNEEEAILKIKPQNYREFAFKKNTIAGMARAGVGNNMLDSHLVQILKKMNFVVIINLHHSIDYPEIAKAYGLDYMREAIDDFTSPSMKSFEKICDFVESYPHEKIAIHCGEGLGRTGTVLAAIKLRELMIDYPGHQPIDNRNTSYVYVGDHGGNQNIPCTELVKQAIDFVRAAENSSNSIEQGSQIECLCDYQKYLVEKFRAAEETNLLRLMAKKNRM